MFDCILLLQTVGPLAPGTTATVPIRFLSPDLIKPRLATGVRFKLWEIRDIADGIVDEVFPD
jgi:hypothetical protein